MINVLQILPSLTIDSGITSFVLNMKRYIDPECFHFDFFHHAVLDGQLPPGSLDNSLVASGSKVYSVTHAKQSAIGFMHEANDVLEKIGQNYQIVHCHVPNNAFVTLRACQKEGVGVRIIHSHLNSSSDNAFHRVRNKPLIALGKKYANAYLACSNEAGHYLFGKDSFQVINNGIHLENFVFDDSFRGRMRCELGIPQSAPVIGCVGRFVQQKNYLFAVNVFKAFLANSRDARLVILGDGEDRALIEARVNELGLSDRILFLGVRDDVARFYSVFDVFFMPSLCEGLPISAVEAQASGLPCVFSTNVPKESDIIGTGKFISLDESFSVWCSSLQDAIVSGRLRNSQAKLISAGYSAKENANKLMAYYEMLINGAYKC